MCKTVDVGGPFQLLVKGGLNVRNQALGAKICLSLNFRLRLFSSAMKFGDYHSVTWLSCIHELIVSGYSELWKRTDILQRR